MKVIGMANRKRFYPGLSMVIGILVAHLACVVIPGSSEAQLSPDVLYQRDIRDVQRTPAQPAPQPQAVPAPTAVPHPAVKDRQPKREFPAAPPSSVKKAAPAELQVTKADVWQLNQNMEALKKSIDQLNKTLDKLADALARQKQGPQ